MGLRRRATAQGGIGLIVDGARAAGSRSRDIAGFKSRWTIPRLWARMHAGQHFGHPGRGGRRLRFAAEGQLYRRLQNSSEKADRGTPVSNTCTMFGWRSAAIAWACCETGPGQRPVLATPRGSSSRRPAGQTDLRACTRHPSRLRPGAEPGIPGRISTGPEYRSRD